jgi:sugar/nucleoside kinase (ribokinase family)
VTGVLVSGNIVCDVVARPVAQIPWGGTAPVESIERRLGGNGANTAYTLAVLGAKVRLAGCVGEDDAGEFALGQLRHAGVDLSLVRRSPLPTSSTIVLVASDGQRGFLHLFGASADVDLTPQEIVAAGCAHYHLASPFGLPRIRARKAELLKAARQAGIATSLDTHWDSQGEWMCDLAPCLPFVDYFFLNEDEARMITGHFEPAEIARVCRAAGAGAVVIKRGARGCAVFARGEEFSMPAFAAEAVDTTGAGDCFAAGFLAGLARGDALPESARLGCAAGALSVSRVGAVTAISPEEFTRFWERVATAGGTKDRQR